MIQCPRCGKYFKNKQALKAHSRFCGRSSMENPDQGDINFFKALLADVILCFVVKERRKRIKASDVAEVFGISLQTANEFLRWLESTEYGKLIRFVSKGIEGG